MRWVDRSFFVAALSKKVGQGFTIRNNIINANHPNRQYRMVFVKFCLPLNASFPYLARSGSAAILFSADVSVACLRSVFGRRCLKKNKNDTLTSLFLSSFYPLKLYKIGFPLGFPLPMPYHLCESLFYRKIPLFCPPRCFPFCGHSVQPWGDPPSDSGDPRLFVQLSNKVESFPKGFDRIIPR